MDVGNVDGVKIIYIVDWLPSDDNGLTKFKKNTTVNLGI
jgi:hypothetical protein